MTPLKPYLIRSIHEWIIDNQLTPHLLVDAENHESLVPQDFVENGKIVLNIRPEAVQELTLGNEDIRFDARFSGKSMHIMVPTVSVLAIYAKENGKGMVFDQEEPGNTPPPDKKPAPPQLKIVK